MAGTWNNKKKTFANKFLSFAFENYCLTQKRRIYRMSLVVISVNKNSFCLLLIITSEKIKERKRYKKKSTGSGYF